MSDYEMLNQRIAAKKAIRRKDTLIRLAFLFAIVLVVVLAFVGLNYIGFISDLFMVILALGALLVGAFKAGRIWNGFVR